MTIENLQQRLRIILALDWCVFEPPIQGINGEKQPQGEDKKRKCLTAIILKTNFYFAYVV